MATRGLMKVRAIQITKELFFWPSDWLASWRKRSPPNTPPSRKFKIQITSEISAMERTVEADAATSWRRKSAALEHMMKSASSQSGKENLLPRWTTDCVFGGNPLDRRARSEERRVGK